jgi:hypothetical protein
LKSFNSDEHHYYGSEFRIDKNLLKHIHLTNSIPEVTLILHKTKTEKKAEAKIGDSSIYQLSAKDLLVTITFVQKETT